MVTSSKGMENVYLQATREQKKIVTAPLENEHVVNQHFLHAWVFWKEHTF